MDEELALFVLGVLRGAVDWERNPNNPWYGSMRYFGSPWRYREFAAKTTELGLVVPNPAEWSEAVDATWSEHVPTDAGRAFYEAHRMAEFPRGRAYSWQGDLVSEAIEAVMKLEASQ